MRIERIKIENYRSIKSADESFDPFIVLVGQNNHGKTNLFEAIDWFFSGFSRGETVDNIKCRSASPDDHVTVEITFSGLQAAIAGMSNAAKKKSMGDDFPKTGTLTVRRTTQLDGGKKRELYNPEKDEWKNVMGADSTWGDLLPTVEYIHTKTALSDVGGYKRSSPIAEMLSGVLATIVEGNETYQQFREKFDQLFGDEASEVRIKLDEIGSQVQVYLQKQFPDGTTVKFDVQNPVFEDLLKNFETEVDDGVVTPAEDKGDGMQRAIMLSIIQAYADYRRKNDVSQKFIFLIDEAELHLHPTAQRALKRALFDISELGEQVLINTHSSVLITDSTDAQTIIKVEKNDGNTSLKQIDEAGKQQVVFELLGGSPADLLFPRNFIIVEGKSDFVFLQDICARFFVEQSTNVQIAFSGGDITEQEGTLHGVHKMYAPLATSPAPIYKEKVVIMCDHPNQQNQKKYDQFRAGYPYLKEGEQLFILPTQSIEEYYPNRWKKTADEVAAMTGDKEKVTYAKQVAANIKLQEIIDEMPILHDCLQQCFKRSF